MMIKVFTSTDGQIHLTAEELERLLKEAFDEGYANGKYLSQTAPSINSPIIWPSDITCEPSSTTSVSDGKPLTIKYDDHFEHAIYREKKDGRK